MEIKPIGYIKNAFPTKFGLPRQSGLCKSITSTLIFEPEYRVAEALRGLEKYSHVWIIWEFSENTGKEFSPTVRPPRLGGNTRLGVFATRSPFRPNALGLSSVRIDSIEKTAQYGTVIHDCGADLMDGTPIYDIKPYIPYADCHPDAVGGFTDKANDFILNVNFPTELLSCIPIEKQQALNDVLSHDPRPSYQQESDRVYGISFGSWNIRFTVQDSTLTVCSVQQEKK